MSAADSAGSIIYTNAISREPTKKRVLTVRSPVSPTTGVDVDVCPVYEPEVAQEESRVKVLKIPVKLSQKKIEEHECAGHVPFKSWCAFCVRGR